MQFFLYLDNEFKTNFACFVGRFARDGCSQFYDRLEQRNTIGRSVGLLQTWAVP